MTANASQPNNTTGFQLKRSRLTLTTLELLSLELEIIRLQLTEQAQLAPNLLHDMPVILSLEKVALPEKTCNVNAIVHECERMGLRIIAIRAQAHWRPYLKSIEIAYLPTLSAQSDEPISKPQRQITEQTPNPEPKPASPTHIVVNRPVRSGQQVIAPEGDLIVLAPVSAGAELLAKGNIHIYGPLRGRALAGIEGNTKAGIFCLQFAAELVAIAGHYMTEMAPFQSFWQKGAHIFREGENLQILPL
ncbi:septum site-determining protein MinC [Zooshikella marina]|uniref:septum site-determining protein MinC n=1 Tax=Zooshikella ganghwensis TaxID=202772 RepID=UPI000409A7AE|nr:septum site-determining protein MinC [Zooshikella ganghwensis]MBU2704659.1 septum site-determining protein MinC [Zooshikella ganghwensis]